MKVTSTVLRGVGGSNAFLLTRPPGYICRLMYDLAVRYGFDGGTVLEPSVATGRLVSPLPDKSKVTVFEINPVTARICEINYPQVKVHQGYFETAFLTPPRFTIRLSPEKLTWLEGYPFSLVIGNPPYGKYRNRYSSYFPHPRMHQIELFFMYYGLRLLKPGGLLVYLTSSNFLRNGISYNPEKEEIGKLADLKDAYRLPPVFKFSQVPTDIIVLKKK